MRLEWRAEYARAVCALDEQYYYEEGEVEISTVPPTLPVRVKDEEYKLRGWVMLLVRNK